MPLAYLRRMGLACAGSLAIAGCASFDPNSIISRHGMPQESNVPVSSSQTTTLTAGLREEAFDFVWNTVQERYYDPRLNGVDWQSIRGKYYPLALAAEGEEAFWDTLDKMTGELKDSHTRVESPKRAADRRRYENQTLGMGVALIDDQLVVTGISGSSDAWWAGARPGMVVRSVDGEDAITVYRRILDSTRAASTQRARYLSAQGKLNRGEPGSIVTLTFERGDGTVFPAALKRRLIVSPPSVQSRLLPSGFGYVRFSNFLPSLSGQVNAALREYKNTPGLIIDLRNNGGGSLEMAKDLIGAFFNRNVQMSKQITRTGRPITIAWGIVEVIKMEYQTSVNPDAYVGKVVVLTNAASASASELFSAAMQDLGRATIIGEPTCGCLLGYLGYSNVPGGGEMAYSEIGFITPGGRRIEGEGVVPDKLVPLTITDLLVSRDRVFEEAQEMLKVEIAGKNLAGTRN